MLQFVSLGFDRNLSPRVMFGIELLKQALQSCGYIVHERPEGWTWDQYRSTGERKIFVGNRFESELLRELEERDVLLYHAEPPFGEGFYLSACAGRLLTVSGGSDNGVLYGCQELAGIIRDSGLLPWDIAFGDAPQFKLRGPALALLKSTIEAPRLAHEYPITQERFPWFYDQSLWLEYLDMLLEYRSNVLYLWSGHPFSSLVRLPDYPEALEVTDEQLEQNEKTFRWLTEEADKRGIRIVLHFYNIHIPLPFAEKHGLSLEQTKPLPITSDYYKQAIAAFVRNFPNVGLMVCLVEKLTGQIFGIEWFTETILAGVIEGLRGLDIKEMPPVILRSQGIQANKVVEAALPLYPNLHTEAKYNGESLTTWTPRGEWQQHHTVLASLPGIHIANVHTLANLEPFRWGSPAFIQKCMQAAKYRLKASGLHLFPLAFYNGPYTPDRVEPRLRQMDRDWIWYAAWLRYAWNPDREPGAERIYWTQLLEKRYGNREAAKSVLEAYDAFGQCAPKLLRRFGITQGNRQTMSLGMTMSQLTNPDPYVPWPELWESNAPQGERLEEYVIKELAGMPHVGETPLDMIEEVERHAEEADNAIKRARFLVARSKNEFERLASDIDAIRAMVCVYTYKVRAALLVLMYKHTVSGRYSEKVELLEEAEQWLEKSLSSYRLLTSITEKQYLYANGIQTNQRKIPLRDGADYKHWRDCLPVYEAELESFRTHVKDLKAGRLPAALRQPVTKIPPYRPVEFVLHSTGTEPYRIEKGARVFTDGDIPIIGCAEELYGLTGIRFSQAQAGKKAVTIDIELMEPCKVLVGYFHSKESQWLQPPEHDKHDGMSCGCNPVIYKGVRLFSYPSVHVHAYLYEAGRHRLQFGKGAYLILGVIGAEQETPFREFEMRNDGIASMDWLYEQSKEAVVK